MLHKLFPKISALALALAIGCMTVLLIQSPSQAKEPEWIGPWYSELIATRDAQWPVQAHPQFLTIPDYSGWAWLEENQYTRLARIAQDGSVNLVGGSPFESLAVSHQSLGEPVVGIVTEFGGAMNAFDLLRMSEVGWTGHMINMPGFVPSQLHTGRAQSANVNAKVYSFVYNQVDRVYLSYRSTLPAQFTDQLVNQVYSSDDEKQLQQVDTSQTDMIKKVQDQLESNLAFKKDLQQWLDKNADVTKYISVINLLESKQLDHPEVLTLLQENNLDFAIADTNGLLAPSAFIQEPIPQASWWEKPLELRLGMVEPSSLGQPKTDLMLFSVIDGSWGGEVKKLVVSTNCQMSNDSYGYLSHECGSGVSFLPFHFSPNSDVKLMNNSSVPGWLRQAVIEKPVSGNDRVMVMKNEIMSASFWYEPRAFVEYSSQGEISSATVLSLSDNKFMLVVVDNGELKIFLVNDQNSTPVFEPWPVPVSAAKSFRSVELSRDGDAMVMTAVTNNNQIWKFMANVPGTIWTP